jgi:hypothetical protein
MPPKAGDWNNQNGVAIPSINREKNGIYYNQEPTVSLKSLIVPAGWNMPLFADFAALFDAAIAEGAEVLRDPDLYPGEDHAHYNEWKMNMGATGRYIWSFYNFSWDPSSCFYVFDNENSTYGNKSDGSKHTFCFWWGDYNQGSKDSGGAPVRLIYIGDN